MKYIELYGGIGGFRKGIEQAGKTWECVWYCDKDKYATQVFNRNFNERYTPTDIRSVNVRDIPDHDFLCAGFPCQSFSLAGKRRGFNDTRGTLFFEIVRILRDKSPKYFLLENVEGLLSHDGGKTFNTIVSLLGKTVNNQSFLHKTEDCLNYNIFWTILNSKNFGVPQSRPRVFLIGFREDMKVNKFSFPKGNNIEVSLFDILEDEVDEKYYLSEKMQQRFREYIQNNKINMGNVFTVERKEIRKHKTTNEVPTLKTRMGTGGNNVPIVARCLDANMGKGIMPKDFFEKGKRNIILGERLRRLTPIECERLQGFPDRWTEKGLDENGKVHKISDSQRYKMLGNAVTTNVIEAIISNLEMI